VSSAGRQEYQPYVLALTRLHHKKNLEALIEAFTLAAPEPWQLVISGSGNAAYARRLERLADESGGDRIRLVGWADDLRKRALIPAASLFALVSWQENFAVSVLEALASGVPALVSDRVGLADLVQQRNAGWVVEPSVASIAGGLSSALEDDVERQSRALAARTMARDFEWTEIADQIADVYAGLIRNARASELRRPQATAGL
jgi:glycosyltransferase involved in cell wall biosynthesis